ncbi:hypothetical protein NE235_17975 [Actinoallomurus spadix]|nr:hypothetical protein [Actinoallomurus spadix]MCO5987992.1 hypothetical protein [Actinoallomurus spadix]
MGNVRKTAAVVMGVAASLAFAVPVAQAAPGSALRPMHYSCGQTRPPNLDGSAFVTATGAAVMLRGSSAGCGLTGVILGGDRLDYYCWTLGNDGYTYTFVSAFEKGAAGWALDSEIPNNGSSVHCPI